MSSSSGTSRGRSLAGVIFDVDGTLVDSEAAGHRVAFNAAFAEAGLPYRWDEAEYGRLLRITGGKRRIAQFLAEVGHTQADAVELADILHKAKTKIFLELISSGGVPPRAGAAELVNQLCSAGARVAVATTGSREWVIPLLDQCFGPDRFDLILTGTEVPLLKPDPAVFSAVASKIPCGPDEIVAIEDSRNGLLASLAAGVPCVIVTNDYTVHEDFSGALAVFDRFGEASSTTGEPSSATRHVGHQQRRPERPALTVDVLFELFSSID